MDQERLDGQRFALNPLHEKERTPQPCPLAVVPAHFNQQILEAVTIEVAASQFAEVVAPPSESAKSAHSSDVIR